MQLMVSLLNPEPCFSLTEFPVCQIDSCRTSGVNEILSILLMAAKFGVPVCPHSGMS